MIILLTASLVIKKFKTFCWNMHYWIINSKLIIFSANNYPVFLDWIGKRDIYLVPNAPCTLIRTFFNIPLLWKLVYTSFTYSGVISKDDILILTLCVNIGFFELFFRFDGIYSTLLSVTTSTISFCSFTFRKPRLLQQRNYTLKHVPEDGSFYRVCKQIQPLTLFLLCYVFHMELFRHGNLSSYIHSTFAEYHSPHPFKDSNVNFSDCCDSTSLQMFEAPNLGPQKRWIILYNLSSCNVEYITALNMFFGVFIDRSMIISSSTP